MTSAQAKWWRRLHDWADVIHADFQTVVSRYLQNISTYLFCTTERMLRTIIMQNSRMIQACYHIKIDEVWIDRYCVRYDWWRRLQPTSSVSPVWAWHESNCCFKRLAMLSKLLWKLIIQPIIVSSLAHCPKKFCKIQKLKFNTFLNNGH